MTIIHGDCVQVMAGMPEASVDAIVTDPPYGLGFMGRQWDHLPPGPDFVEQALRVLKPGAHLLAAGGSRTYHRLTCAIEDAGFEIRDCITWLYGSGFPKSHNLPGGLGTALKPAAEFWVLARKPLTGTVAATVLEYGTGALNIDATRIAGGGPKGEGGRLQGATGSVSAFNAGNHRPVDDSSGRWPANVILDPEAAALLDQQTGELHSQDPATRNGGRKPGWSPAATARPMLDKSNPNGGDRGGASRFFYVAKASSRERNAGLDAFEEKAAATGSGNDRGARRVGDGWEYDREPHPRRNVHPTVKPIALMRWLVRLVTPPDGTVLDPFAGSGTTGIAAALEDRAFVGIEREAEYVAIAEARIAHAKGQPRPVEQLPLAA